MDPKTYSEIVAKRPELVAKDWMGRPVEFDNSKGWILALTYCPPENGLAACEIIEESICMHDAHCRICRRWTEMLPVGAVLHHAQDWPEYSAEGRGNWVVDYVVKRMDQMGKHSSARGATPLKALTEFWRTYEGG